MAKKNRKNFHFFSSPLSPRKVLVFGFACLLLVAANIATVNTKWKQEDAAEAENRKKLSQLDIVNILGATTVTDDEETNFKKNKDVSYWYSIISQRPLYRDAYLILATLAYNDRKCTLAKKHLSSAFVLDPVLVKNNPIFQIIDACH